MNEEFRKLIEALDPAYQRLVTMVPVQVTKLPRNMPEAGVYLLSEQSSPLYVGRSNRMRARLQEHCRPSSGHNAAPFAFRLARETSGQMKASYAREGSRSQLACDPDFKREFDLAKQRIRQMEIRFVEETNPLSQGLLEVYAALACGARYNDFDTH